MNEGILGALWGRRAVVGAALFGVLAVEGAYGCVGEAGTEDFIEENVGEVADAVYGDEPQVPPGQLTDVYSTLSSGIDDCMGDGEQCQIAKAVTPFTCPPNTLCKLNPQATLTVYTAFGGVAGSPTLFSYRCGSSAAAARNYLEVYVDDPTLDWPDLCVPLGGSFVMQAGVRYDVRGPSIAGGGTVLPFELHAERLAAPTDLQVLANGVMKLSWLDRSWGEQGQRVERRYQYTFAEPAHASNRIGVSAPYLDSAASSKLLASATQYCQEKGYVDQDGYAVAPPVGGVHTWLESGQWTVSGNNNVYYLSSVSCRTGWAEIAVLGPDTTSYQDAFDWSASRQEYRVRAYKGASFSQYSNTAGDFPKVIVGL